MKISNVKRCKIQVNIVINIEPENLLLYEYPSVYRIYFTFLSKFEVELCARELFSLTYYDQVFF